MIPSYEATLSAVRICRQRAKERGDEGLGDLVRLREMEREIRFVLDWLHIGFNPEDRKGARKNPRDHYEFAVDPVMLDWMADPDVEWTAGTGCQDEPLNDRWRSLLSPLSPRERRAVVLVYAEGYSAVMAAQIMNVKDVTVRKLLFRARKKLVLHNHRAVNEDPPQAGMDERSSPSQTGTDSVRLDASVEPGSERDRPFEKGRDFVNG